MSHPAELEQRVRVLETTGGGGGGGGAVSSVFGRSGAVVANSGDYSFAQIGAKPTTLAGYGITDAAALVHGHTAATTVADGYLSAADKTKLDGIANGATANSSDAALRDRSTHTGTQAGSTVTGAYTAAGMTLATGRLLGRTTAATGAAEEITPNATAFTLSAGALAPVFGTTAGTIAEGNHGHGQLHNQLHAISSTADHSAGNWKLFHSNGAGQVVELTLPASGYLKSTGTAAAPTFDQPELYNSSTAAQGAGFAADTYLTGSSINVTGRLKAGTQYRCVFDVSKTAAGVATPIIIVRFGTAGTTADAARATLTFPAQTAVVDNGRFEVRVNVRSVGATGVIQAIGTLLHGLAATGFSTSNAPTILNTSAAFDTTVANSLIGLSVNGGASAAWTVQLVQAELVNLA